MWHKNFADRLAAWNDLRQQASELDLTSSLSAINSWWFQTPWIPYHLHWDDRQEWPDPWQLLDDNIYCGLARGLGMLYTVTLLDRPDLQDAVLIEVGGDNLVLIGQEKYILNWDSETVVNISPGEKKNPLHCITQQQLKTKLR
jgi:hypothetical protein